MKRFMAFVLAGVLCLLGTACSAGGKSEVVDAPLEEVMNEILADVPNDFEVDNEPVDKEHFSWYFGIDYVEGAEGFSSEALISALPHSLALLRVPEGENAAALAKDIEEKIDPRKWVCVEAEKTVVKQRGNLILVIMTFEDRADTIAQAFDAYIEK